MNRSRVSSHQEEQRHFVDALREALGLEPLYRSDHSSPTIRVYPEIGSSEYGCRRVSSTRPL